MRTRIAPTPSGYLHLGNAFSFAITAALARQYGARILLRIDDLDRQRVQKAYVQDIFDCLEYLEIPWDEGPRNYHEYEAEYSQLHRIPLYEQALQQLAADGDVFACDCSRAMVLRQAPDGAYPGTCLYRGLPMEGTGGNWRLDTSTERTLAVRGPDGVKAQATLTPSMRYFVVRKKDGLPAYQLASLVDDRHFGVDLVVRGMDLWESTLAQMYMAQVLGYKRFINNTFVHHPLLMDTAGGKLSKSAGATSIKYLRQQGKSREEIYATIGKLLGLARPVSNWLELGMLQLHNHRFG